MPKLLLTTVCRPFGGNGEGDSVGAELFHAQVTRSQGIFSYRQVIRCWGLDYIAENIDASSVVLHYPSEREFLREIRNGNYDFIGIDEDFFIHAKRAREFLACVREGGRPLSIMGFGSVRGLSQFTADEIAEMGFDILWTAFEGSGSGYDKLKGQDLDVLYQGLKSRGVAILNSMIVGFPFQDRSRVLEDFRKLTEFGPALWQILIYFAFPGTPLYRQVLAEGRYLPEYLDHPDYRTFDGFSMHFKHPHFTPTELENLQRELYRKAFELLGPSLIRVVRTQNKRAVLNS